MRRVIQDNKTICEFPGRYVDYPSLYKAITGNEPDRSEWKMSGNIDGLSITEFIKANKLEVECWD